jgi:hypothetical protein
MKPSCALADIAPNRVESNPHGKWQPEVEQVVKSILTWHQGISLRQGLNGIPRTLKERGKLVNRPRTVAVFFRQQRPLELSDGSSHIDLVDAKHKIAWN